MLKSILPGRHSKTASLHNHQRKRLYQDHVQGYHKRSLSIARVGYGHVKNRESLVLGLVLPFDPW